MWDYIKTAFSFVSGIFKSNPKGDGVNNIFGYVLAGLIAFIICLCIIISTNRATIHELQGQVNSGQIALEYQNAMISTNRARTDALNKELQSYIEKVKTDFGNVKTPIVNRKEPKNECEIFLKDLAEAYQK